MARLLFIGLVIAVIAMIWRSRNSVGGRASKRLMLLGFAILVIFTILFPQTTTVVAGWIGIGRGSDLVFYLTSFAVMFLAALVYLEFRRMEDRIAQLTRQLALNGWEAERLGQDKPLDDEGTRDAHDRGTRTATRIDPEAEVSPEALIGEGSSIWQFAHVREQAQLGQGCVVGRGAYIGPGVRIGANVKIQNYALLYEPARISDGAFIGPSVVLTNDRFPRSINPDGSRKASADWDSVGVTVQEGASIGARAVCVAPVTIGRWAMVAAGATVVGDVPDFALVVGVPARRVGWVGRAGVPLRAGEANGSWMCPATGMRFQQISADHLEELP